MDIEAYKKSHLRISELTGMTGEGLDNLEEIVGDTAGLWAVAVDHPSGGPDNDTFKMPADRLLVLGPDRKVMAKNLPSYISYIYPGRVVPLDRTVEGDIGTVYYDTDAGAVTYYRYIQDNTVPLASRYVSIPSGMRLVDGQGTVVTDEPSAHTRKIDVAVGNPVARQSKVIALSGKKLVHTKSAYGVQVTLPMAQQSHPSDTDFTDTGKNWFNVPAIPFDSTGHLGSLPVDYADDKVTFPSTRAGSSDAGITLLSGNSPEPVGGSNRSGSSSLASPADHVHAAATLTFKNYPSNGQKVDLEYDMAPQNPPLGDMGLMVDFSGLLGAQLPEQRADVTDKRILSYDGASSKWKTVQELFSPDKSDATITGQAVAIGTATPIASISGLTAGRAYLVRVSARATLQPAVSNTVLPLPGIYTVTIDIGGITRKFNVSGAAGNVSGGQGANMFVQECVLVMPQSTVIPVTASCDAGTVYLTVDGATAIRLR